MNGVSLSNQVIHWNPKKFAVKQNFNKVIKENEKVFNLTEKKFTLARGGTLTCSSRQLHKNNFAVDCLKWQD